MIEAAGILNSFLAAIQASLSVLLVIFYGGLAGHFKLLDSRSTKIMSKLCVKMFLPALLFTQIGNELHSGSAHRYLIILIWAFICHFISFLIGIIGYLFLGMPDWITAAIMFNNTTSYPLLLIQSLDETGILQSLIATDETSRAAIERAKSYFLVFATVSSCLTFAVGPRLIDMEHAPERDPDETDESEDGYDADIENSHADEDTDGDISPTAETHLISHTSSRRVSVVPVSFFPSKPREMPQTPKPTIYYNRRPSVIEKRKWLKLSDRARWWLLFAFDFVNAPVIGALLGAIIGLIPILHRSFFNVTQEGGIFTAWLTQSLKTIGSVFVPLPVIIAGFSLYSSIQKSRSEEHRNEDASTPWMTTTFVLVMRFIVWPVLSIAVIFNLARETELLGTDPMLWFTMMLMPTGPPAMKLITMVEVSDASEEDEHKIAKLLTISYIISPILAFTVVASLRATQAAI